MPSLAKRGRSAASVLGRIVGAEIFAAGQHRDDEPPVTLADLDAIAGNFNIARGYLDPPLATGHPEAQKLVLPLRKDKRWVNDFRENTGNPAIGWVARVYRKGPKLYADFDGVPRKIARLVELGLYKKFSAEIYDAPPRGVPKTCSGPMLRRVSILGAAVPQIKTLADIPVAYFSEERRALYKWPVVHQTKTERLTLDGCNVVRSYAEGEPMDRKEKRQKLAESGLSEQELVVLDKMSDEDFGAYFEAWLLRQSGLGGEGGTEGEEEEEPGTFVEWPEGMDRDSVIAALVEMGEDETLLADMDDDSLLALYQEKLSQMAERRRQRCQARKHSEGRDVKKGKGGVRKHAETPITRKDLLILRRQLDAATARAKAAEKRSQEAVKEATRRAYAERKRTVDALLDGWLGENKITPADADKGAKGPNLRNRLIAADGSRLRKYGEAKVTEFDAIKAEIDGRPVGYVRQFNERLKQQNKAGDAGTGDDFADAVASARQYAERLNKSAQNGRFQGNANHN